MMHTSIFNREHTKVMHDRLASIIHPFLFLLLPLKWKWLLRMHAKDGYCPCKGGPGWRKTSRCPLFFEGIGVPSIVIHERESPAKAPLTALNRQISLSQHDTSELLIPQMN